MQSVLTLLILAAAGAAAVPQEWNPTCDATRTWDCIPTDLEDSLVQLFCLLEAETTRELKAGSEAELSEYHFGLGMYLRNNWGLWGGSRLNKYFQEVGLDHADDMSGVILTSYWRRLNNRPL